MAYIPFAAAIAFCALISATHARYAPPSIRNAPLDSPQQPGLLGRRSMLDAFPRVRSVKKRNETEMYQVLEDTTIFALSQGVGDEIPQQQDHAILLESGIEVTCVYCYITAQAGFEVEVPDIGEITTYLGDVRAAIEDSVGDLVVLGQDLSFPDDDGANADSHALDDVANVTLPQPPDVYLRVELSDVELYAELQTVINGQATFTLNLYRSLSPVGIWLDEQNEIGAIFTVDLLLSADADIAIESGFHIKLDKGISFELALFDQNVNNLRIGDGHFEFLPVSVVGAGVSLGAVLRVGARVGLRAGVEVDFTDIDFGFGAGVSFFVDVAAFDTSVNSINPAAAGEATGCLIEATNTYGFAIGGAVGASAYFMETTWGPVLETTTALVSELYPPVCVETFTTTSTDGGSLAARQTTIASSTTVEAATAIACKSPGIMDCPLSLQEVVTGTVTRTVTASTSEEGQGSPTTALSTRPFGTAVRQLRSTAGLPTPVESATLITDAPSGVGSSSKNGGNSRAIIIGVSVGVGVLLLAGAIGCLWWYLRLRKTRKLVVKKQLETPPTKRPSNGYLEDTG